uniref:Uncharacterized protein n=1 Tax=Romanomermis culicivorax TaxID=13658 RepID=A0A915J2W0_ROMCU
MRNVIHVEKDTSQNQQNSLALQNENSKFLENMLPSYCLNLFTVLLAQYVEFRLAVFSTFTAGLTSFYEPPPIQGIVDAFGNINTIGLSETVNRRSVELQRFSNQYPSSSTTPTFSSNPTTSSASSNVYYSNDIKFGKSNSRRKWSDGRIFWQKLFPNLFDESNDDSNGNNNDNYNRKIHAIDLNSTADDGRRSETAFKRKILMNSPSSSRIWLRSDYSERGKSSTMSSWHAPFYAKNFAVDLAQNNENDDFM